MFSLCWAAWWWMNMGSLHGILVVLILICNARDAQLGCGTADPQLCEQYADEKERYCAREYIQNNCLNMCGRCGCPTSDPIFCDIYASKPKFYCQHSWIKNRCKILCGLCDENHVTTLPPVTSRPSTSMKSTKGGPPGCSAPDPVLCEKYVDFRKHYCLNEWVTKRCKHLCGLCGEVTDRPTIPTTVTTTTTATTTITILPPGCSSPDPKLCEKYVKRKKAYCKQVWVQKRCGHLCGQCDANITAVTTPPTNATECELSDLKVCKTYERTKKHYCMNAWVQDNCKNLCGLCDTDGTTTPPRTTPITSTAPVGCGYSDPQYCEKYAPRKKHYCMNAWVQNRCKNLCDQCGNKQVTKRPTRATSTRSVGCGYSDPQYCRSYARRKSHYCTNTWVQNRCKNLCGLCGNKRVTSRPTKSTGGCEISDPQFCKRYARYMYVDYCSNTWVKNKCKHLCGLCAKTTPSTSFMNNRRSK